MKVCNIVEPNPGGHGVGPIVALCDGHTLSRLRHRDSETAPEYDWTARSVVKHNAQQRRVDLEVAVVFDVAELAEFRHEKVHARPRRPDHFRERLLRQLR